MLDVIFIGLSTVDVIYNVAQFPAANQKVAARSQSVFVGGPAANASFAFAHLGGKAALVTLVGRHPLAAMVRDEMSRFSVQLIDLNPEFDDVPAISSITVDQNGRRNVVSANALRMPAPPAHADTKIIERAKLVMVDGHHMEACQVWAAAARALGRPVVLDGGSWKAGTDELLRSVHSAICSADFLPPGCAGSHQVLDYLKTCGVENIAITHGGDPIEYVTAQTQGVLPVPGVEAADSTGAGDVLHGAFCFYSSIGHSFVEALNMAAKVAAESCRYQGTRAWMREPRA